MNAQARICVSMSPFSGKVQHLSNYFRESTCGKTADFFPRGTVVERSLTALLPVQDAQDSLAATVGELLEILSELTSRFELMIVDDGSTDFTIEVANELAVEYPQIRLLRHFPPLGRPQAIAVGFRQSRGEVVFLRDEDCRLPINKAHRLWRAMDHHEIALGRAARLSHAKAIRRSTTTEADREGGFSMLKRAAAASLIESLHHQTALVQALAKLPTRWYEIEIAGRVPENGSRQVACPHFFTSSQRDGGGRVHSVSPLAQSRRASCQPMREGVA